MRIVILTGAGVSAESGLGTFRDVGGVWDQYDLARVATPEGFARDRALVHAFYNERRANMRAARPNAAHHALARLQQARPGAVTLVTQNIDDLHLRAGSPEVIAMHGALDQALCAACGHRWPAPAVMGPDDPCPACGAPETRPDVVWFGEMPYHMERVDRALAGADLFVAIGTSGAVYPAAGFVAEAAAHGAGTLEINLAPSDVADAFDRHHFGPATQTVPAWVATLID
ncbi:NAD-dependent deacylase [Rhodobaculum claviforme]|uniref:NAD-dependent protein deacylase n=1 Tax=Rhodobaculum claviforme TaxID=1549854 RepID=A0A934TJ74_9RHOB|nr:NAD-dependent deacylase [Rhodobaculum claviforme]MBK5926770.1 NAD-dependent protein deacylase [Rhodobaculum claviforme]